MHKCKACPRFFKSIEDRDAHAVDEHKEKIVCELCKKSFRNDYGFALHNRTYHKGVLQKPRKKTVHEMIFKCKYCRLKYFTQNGLDKHTTEHGKNWF